MALDTHTQTLQALDSFIAAQRLLIARQRDDIERLQTLMRDMPENISAVLGNLSDELGHTAFHLSAQTDLRLGLPNGISWSLFDKADTTPLHTLASQFRQKYTSRSTPSKCQQSCLSELQMLVKKARKEIIDPVLEWVAKSTTTLMTDSDDEGDERSDGLNNSQRKQGDKPDAQAQIPPPSHIGPIETRTKKVNIAAGTDRSQKQTKPFTDGDERPRKKAKITLPTKRIQSTAKRNSPIPKNASATPDATIDKGLSPLGGSPKPRPDTYKQAWSMDEQHLLEQLLEKIPDGEKNRWLKISQAMGGRRTPRQVASRVQKYLEKLKKFGVAVG